MDGKNKHYLDEEEKDLEKAIASIDINKIQRLSSKLQVVFIEVRFDKTVEIGLRDYFSGIKWGI
jgi:hypothetical protein